MEHKIEETRQQFRSEQLGFGLGFDEGSFTALLELPPPQAVELLVKENFPAPPPIFPSDIALVDRASAISVFASTDNNERYGNVNDKGNHGDENNDSMRTDTVKQEPVDSDSNQSSKSGKRKEREKKVKESSKKSKKVAANESSDAGGEKLPYVHVRARRGQATDSHSLAERARREKINARMKLLQELVPGCNKISGTAMVLDEIINHVQQLQRQVEFLSMRLATVSPRIDFNLDALLASDHGAAIDNSYPPPGMFTSSVWPNEQVNDARQQQLLTYQQHQWNLEGLPQQPTWCSREEDESNFIAQETSLLSYDSPANSATLHSNQLKMEL